MAPIPPILRRFTRAPMFTGIALITLAIGIGANTAVFSVVNGVLIKPLPYPYADRLVSIRHSAPGAGFRDGTLEVAPAMYFTYREEGRAFQELGLWSSGGATVTGMSEPEQVRTVFLTYGTLQALGVQPSLGRTFWREDDTPGTPDIWQLHFAVSGGKEHNSADPFIANVDEHCEGKWLRVEAQKEGGFRINNSRNKFEKAYQ